MGFEPNPEMPKTTKEPKSFHSENYEVVLES